MSHHVDSTLKTYDSSSSTPSSSLEPYDYTDRRRSMPGAFEFEEDSDEYEFPNLSSDSLSEIMDFKNAVRTATPARASARATPTNLSLKTSEEKPKPPPSEPEFVFSPQQLEVLDRVAKGKSVFFTGSAGMFV